MIPLPWRAIGVVSLILAVLGLVHAVLRAERARGRAECQAAYAATEQTARLEQQRLSNAAQSRLRESYDAYRQRADREAARAASAERELDRVRRAAAATSSGAPASAPATGEGADAAGVLRGLLAEGAELVTEGSRRLGIAAAKVTALQEAARVCSDPSAP